MRRTFKNAVGNSAYGARERQLAVYAQLRRVYERKYRFK